MDSIEGYDFDNRKNVTAEPVAHVPRVTSSSDKPLLSSSTESEQASLTDLTSLGNKASQLAPDVRPEAIERAMRLVNDPNWLNNDDIIDALAEKLIESEGI